MTVAEWLGGLTALATGFLVMSRLLGRRIDELRDELKDQIAQVRGEIAQVRSEVAQVRGEGERAHATIGQAIRDSEERVLKVLGTRIDDLKEHLGTRIDDLKEHVGDRIQDLRQITSERIQDLKEVLGPRP